MFGCNHFNLNTCCVPTCTTTCGPTVVVTCSDCCTRLCSRVLYTVTITNTADCTINCASLHIRVPRAFCFNGNSVTVNGEVRENTTPDCISLGTIEPNATVTVTYQITVMEYRRYNRTQAVLTGLVCCCCESKRVCIPSNVSVLQVCHCCCGGQSEPTTPVTPDPTPEPTPEPTTPEENLGA